MGQKPCVINDCLLKQEEKRFECQASFGGVFWLPLCLFFPS